MKTGRTRFHGLSRGLVRDRGQMNKTESAYAGELKIRKMAGEIASWWFEPFSLRISRPEKGQPARVSPDFMILMPDGTTYIDDVKGGMVDAASIVRMKCAAEQYPLWIFRIVKKRRVKDGGGWSIEEL